MSSCQIPTQDTYPGKPTSHHRIEGHCPCNSPFSIGLRTPHIWYVPPDWRDRSIVPRDGHLEEYGMSFSHTTRTLLTSLVCERHRRPSLWRRVLLEVPTKP